MGFFTLAKRCNFCAHKLDKNGKCVNPSCIAYVKPAETAPDKKESAPQKEGK